MNKKIALTLLAAAALAACDKKEDPTWDFQNNQPKPGAQIQQQDTSHPWLWALGGYFAGRMMSPSPQPQVVQAPAAQPRTVIVNRYYNTPAPTTPAAAKAPVPPPKPASPVITTSPKFTAPAPKASPSPSFSGPKSYGSVTQSRPSYSSGFHSGRK
jgi:hypothetical protein